MDKSWRNHLIFPMIIASSILYAWLLKSIILLVIAGYFLIIICYKKQVILGLLSFFVAFLFLAMYQIRQGVPYPIEEELTLIVKVFPDTIKATDTFVTFEGKTEQGAIYVQYVPKTASEAQEWAKRGDWHKEIQVEGSFNQSLHTRNQHGFNRKWYEFSTNKIGTFKIDKIVAQRKGTLLLYGRKIRAQAIDAVEKHFSGKLAVYMKALLLGYRNQDFQEIRDAYTSSGVLHLFSISGMHISIFFGWCFYFFRRSLLTFEEFSIPFILLMLLFVVLFGQGLSIWRGMLTYLIQFIFKEKQIYWSGLDRFSLMLFILLLIDPKSFIQTSGVLSILLSAILLFSRSYQKNTLRYSIELSLLASPILMFYFYEIPLLGGALTAVITPFFSLILLPGLVGACFWAWIGLPVAFLNVFFDYILKIFEQALAFSSHFVVITGKLSLAGLIGLLVLGLLLYQSKRWQKLYLVGLILFLLIPKIPLSSSVTFVDVGQGDSIVLQSRGNREVYLIDTGGKINYFEPEVKQSQTNADFTLIPFLKGEGIRTIDGLFLTHGDFDHAGDLEQVLKNVHVKKIYIPSGMLQHKIMVNLDKQLLKKTKIVELERGARIGDKIRLEVLAPFGKGEGKNNDSLVLQSKIKGIQFLFMGDLEKEGEAQLLRDYPNLQADVIKIGHHGSRTSSTEAFISQLNAKHSVISCGVNNHFNHPHNEVVERLNQHQIKIFRTDQDGMIRYLWSVRNKWPKVKRVLVNSSPS